MDEAANIYRVTEDFFSESADELNVFRGDVVQLVKTVDKHWYYTLFNGNFGKIPARVVSPVKIFVNWSDVKEIFVALNDFYKAEDGDLDFHTGDIILGLKQIDDNWWEGRCYEKQVVGIFPVTHVWKLDKKYLKAKDVLEESPKFGIVTANLDAKLENELSLRKGERVRIHKSVDKHYYEGECNGVVGVFPKLFIKLEEAENEGSSFLVAASAPSPSPNVSTEEASLDIPPSYEEVFNIGYSNSNTEFDVKSYGRALYPFIAEYPNELSFNQGDIIHLIRYVDSEWIEGELNDKIGVFPKNFIDIIVDCDEKPNHCVEPIAEDYPPGTSAVALHDFEGEMQGDLPIAVGQVVTLLRKLGDDWVEAVDSFGRSGVCPLNRLRVMENDFKAKSVMDTLFEEPTKPNLINLSPEDELTNVPKISLNAEEAMNIAESESSQPVNCYSNVPTSSENRQKLYDSPVRPAPPVPKKIADVQAMSPMSASETPAQSKPDVVQHPTSSNGANKEDEKRKKAREVRSVTIMEMLQSERDYLRDLKICLNTFTKNEKIVNQLRNCGVIISTLFGNLEEVIMVSEQLTRQLEESTQCKKFENQLVGKCFINSSEQMRQAYGVYCRNHEEVAYRWTQLENNPELKIVLQKGLEIIRKDTNCFDIPALLIKPVQRILKYPLLLNDLIKCTEEDHPDKSDLLTATNVILDMAAEMNEFKRRKDLVFKYRKEEQSSFSSKISKFNMHTMRKKSARLGQRLSSTFGLSSVTKDEEFDTEVQKWKVLEKTIRVFHSDLILYVDHLKELVSTHFQLGEDVAQFYSERSKQVEVDDLRRVQRAILTEHCDEMKKLVDENVSEILKQLLQKFQGPRKLIEKRNDKLVDYDAATKKLESNKDPAKHRILKDEQISAKNNYEALNKQLIDELPKFTSYALDIFRNCIVAVIKARKLFTGRTVKELLPLLELPLIIGSPVNSMEDIIETFQVKHNIAIDQMLLDFLLIPKHIFPGSAVSNSSLDRRNSTRMSKVKIGNSPEVPMSTKSSSKAYSPQSPSQKLYLRNVYKQVYAATEDHDPMDVLDLCVKKGDILGIIKKKDPSGNLYKWFVDNGNSKGFVPSKILRLIQEASPPAASCPNQNISTPLSSLSGYRSKSLDQSQHSSHPNSISTQNVPRSSSTASSPVTSNSVKYPAPPPPPPPRTESCRSSGEHRYEPVPDGDHCYGNTSSSSLMSFDSSPVTNSNSNISLESFDPLSSDFSDLSSPDHRYEAIPENQYEQVPESLKYYVAQYPFTSTGPNQLSLNLGQVVLVKQKHDLLGNQEWWLVENRYGQSGYVPSNYIAPYKKS